MSGQRWAVSPTDLDAHLLVANQQVPGELMARCAAVLPGDARQYDKPPARVCAPRAGSPPRRAVISPGDPRQRLEDDYLAEPFA